MNPTKVNLAEVPDCQVMLKSDANVIQIRDLNVKNQYFNIKMKKSKAKNPFL
jgi:hypothetical protein